MFFSKCIVGESFEGDLSKRDWKGKSEGKLLRVGAQLNAGIWTFLQYKQI